jgi:hypothetical protein
MNISKNYVIYVSLNLFQDLSREGDAETPVRRPDGNSE